MFSGIIEATGRVLKANEGQNSVTIFVEKPMSFNDLGLGDSIAVDGVCLTVEAVAPDSIQFTLGAETLQVTKWQAQSLNGRSVNLERSLKWGDRVHGHLVSGHVETLGKIKRAERNGDSMELEVELPVSLSRFAIAKGSWAINGVSLTINSVSQNSAISCLIPETLKRTNLGRLQSGDTVNVELDAFAKAIHVAVDERLKQLGLLK